MSAHITIKDAFERGPNNFHLVRLLAALAVIYGHSYHVTGQPGADLFLQLVGFKFIGGVAVDIFFVISGFLIVASLERHSVVDYLKARCLRIFPALFVAVLISVLILGPLVSEDPGYWANPQTWHYLYKNALMVSTEYMLPGVFQSNPDHAVNGSLWSLPVEFRLYIVFLLLSVLGMLKRDRYTVLTIATFLLGLVVVPRYPIFTQYENWVNVSAYFMAGALFWKRRSEIRLSPWYVLGVLALCCFFHGTKEFSIAFFIAATYLTFYISFLRVPDWMYIRHTDLSYGVYLYGWPIQSVLVMLRPGQSALFNTVAACVVALCVAALSWNLVEKRALALKRGARARTAV